LQTNSNNKLELNYCW